MALVPASSRAGGPAAGTYLPVANAAGVTVDTTTYPDKIKVTNAEFKTINIAGHEFHPEWNYIIRPHGH